MADSLNATQGSLLGFLHDGPKTGWDLLQEVQGGLSRFWNVTPSHVYRELRALEERGHITAGEPGVRDRRPFSITASGRSAFRGWISQQPGPEQIRFPLLVTLWFGRHVDPDLLSGFIESGRREHEERLRLYEELTPSDPDVGAVVAFGIAYEKAIVQWLMKIQQDRPGPPRRRSANSTSGD
jgi:DNA-binding PadR family transcriptional regulator